MTLYKWSQTASADATADSTINWMEGQAPSSVNDSARAMMAAIAKYRDDVAGAIVTSGTSTGYTLTSYQIFDSLAHLANQIVAFTPHTTNGATVTLNVDGLGAKPLRSAPSVELPAGVLVQGTPYAALYNTSDAAFYLYGFFSNPYTVPIGASVDFWGSTAPNSSFVLMYGQAVSRSTYSVLFGLLNTTYGAGDGSTTFNLPDLRGRVVAGKDDMGGSAALRLTNFYFGANAAALGAVGGSQSHTLTASEIPSISSANASQSITVNVGNGNVVPVTPSAAFLNDSLTGAVTAAYYPRSITWGWTSQASFAGSNSISVTSSNTGGAAHAIVPPTIIANKLIRII